MRICSQFRSLQILIDAATVDNPSLHSLLELLNLNLIHSFHSLAYLSTLNFFIMKTASLIALIVFAALTGYAEAKQLIISGPMPC